MFPGKMEAGKRKLSLFAQSMKAKRNAQEVTSDTIDHEALKANDTKESFGNNSRLLTGQDKDVIHQDNVEKLSKMSAEEILQEKQNLIEELAPGLVGFLKSRKKNEEQDTQPESSMEVENPSSDHLEVKLESIPEVVSGS